MKRSWSPGHCSCPVFGGFWTKITLQKRDPKVLVSLIFSGIFIVVRLFAEVVRDRSRGSYSATGWFIHCLPLEGRIYCSRIRVD